MIIRPIHLLPGREPEAIRWLSETEAQRREAGQISQMVLHNVVDSNDYEFVQVWESRASYDEWRNTATRAQLSDDRARYLTHSPTRLYDIVG
jgi:heme-degrading monooxygenase HmoA